MRTVRVSIQPGLWILRPLRKCDRTFARGSTISGLSISSYPPSGARDESFVKSRGHTAISHPFAHAAHDVVFDRRRRAVVEEGGPISERSWQTMNHFEHARTGTSAGGTPASVRTLLSPGPRRAPARGAGTRHSRCGRAA